MAETKRISKAKAFTLRLKSKQFASIDHGNHLFVITNPNFSIINPDNSKDAKYVFCTSVRELGNVQKRHIYLADEREAAVAYNGSIYAPDELINALKEEVMPPKNMTFGVFPIQPEFGAQYAEVGIELFDVGTIDR